MYAIVKTGAQQYRVGKNDKILVGHVPAKTGATLTLDQVLLLDDGSKLVCGTPTVSRAQVTAKVVKHTRGEKIMVFKRKRRKATRSLRGHRQPHTLLQITDITLAGKSIAGSATPEAKQAKPSTPTKPATKPKPTAKKE